MCQKDFWARSMVTERVNVRTICLSFRGSLQREPGIHDGVRRPKAACLSGCSTAKADAHGRYAFEASVLWKVHFQVSWLGCLGVEQPTAGHGSQVEEWSATTRALDLLEPPQ